MNDYVLLASQYDFFHGPHRLVNDLHYSMFTNGETVTIAFHKT